MLDKMEWWSEFAQVSLEGCMAPALRIASVGNDRERYRDLLLLADEQWDMVELYLHRGEMFAAYAEDDPCFKIGSAPMPNRALGCMIVTGEGVDERGLRIAEVKSLAVAPSHQRRGVGHAPARIRRRPTRADSRRAAGRYGRQPSDRALLRGLRLHALTRAAQLLHRQLRPPHRRSRSSAERHGHT